MVNKARVIAAFPLIGFGLYFIGISLTQYGFIPLLPLAAGTVLLIFGATDRSFVSWKKQEKP